LKIEAESISWKKKQRVKTKNAIQALELFLDNDIYIEDSKAEIEGIVIVVARTV
jgi:hypothetical protein